MLDIYNFTTTALALTTPVNSNAVIVAAKLANHVNSARGTPISRRATTVTTAQGGTVTVDGSGNLTYSPHSDNYAGSDSFTNTFYDGHGWQTMAVSVTVGNISSGNGANAIYARRRPTATMWCSLRASRRHLHGGDERFGS